MVEGLAAIVAVGHWKGKKIFRELFSARLWPAKKLKMQEFLVSGWAEFPQAIGNEVAVPNVSGHHFSVCGVFPSIESAGEGSAEA